MTDPSSADSAGDDPLHAICAALRAEFGVRALPVAEEQMAVATREARVSWAAIAERLASQDRRR